MPQRVELLLLLAARLDIPAVRLLVQQLPTRLIFGFSLPQTAGQRTMRLSQWLTFLN